jgi:hypothetical protein
MSDTIYAYCRRLGLPSLVNSSDCPTSGVVKCAADGRVVEMCVALVLTLCSAMTMTYSFNNNIVLKWEA